MAAGILVFAILGVIVAYFAWWQPQQSAHEEQDFGFRVDHRIDGKLEQPLKDVHQIQIDVAKIGSRLDKLDQLISPLVEQKLKALGSNPSRKDNQNAAKELLAQARANEQPQIPSTAIKMAGKSFVAASPNDTGAWDVALDLVSYRTSLNILPASVGSTTEHAGGDAKFEVHGPPGKPTPKMGQTQWVSIDQAARYEVLGHPSNPKATAGPGVLVLQDGAVTLDGMELRHVVFINIEVHYGGGPVKLSDVAFIKCSFVIENNEDGHQLALKILGLPAVDFVAKG